MKEKKDTPPLLLLRFFRWFCHPDYLEDIEGDLMERFERTERTKGPKRARRGFLKDVLLLFRPGIIRPVGGTYRLNRYGILTNYLKTAPRIFYRNGQVTFVSLLSLVIGAVGFQLICSWVGNELWTDSFHRNRDDIHVITMRTNPMSKLRRGMLDMDPDHYPSIKGSLRIHDYAADRGKLVYNGRDFKGATWAVDSTFFEFFDFPLAHGSSEGLLSDPTDMVISSSLAERMFGEEDPIGETVELFMENTGSYRIAGIMADLPSNSSMRFDVLVPTHSQDFWGRIPCDLILVDENFEKESFDALIAGKAGLKRQFPEARLGTAALRQLYFDDRFDLALFHKKGDMDRIWAMIAIALMIVTVSAINFTNLQTVLHLSTIRSSVIRHAIGAKRSDLLLQCIVNRSVLFAVALMVSGISLALIFPFYVAVLDTHIDLDLWEGILVMAMVMMSIIMSSIVLSVAQIYNIRVTDVFQGRLANARIPDIQRLLITLQYAIGIFLMIACMMVYLQFDHMMGKDLGYNPENIISIDFFDEQVSGRYGNRDGSIDILEREKKDLGYVWNELKGHPDILGVSRGELPLQGSAYPMDWRPLGGKYGFTAQKTMFLGDGYDDLLGLEIVQGRFFDDSLDNDRDMKVVVNEAALRYWDIDDIGDVRLTNASWGGYEIIGIVRDFNYEHLSSPIDPLMLMYMSDMEDPFLIKMREDKVGECLSFVQDLYKRVNPAGIFDFGSLELQLSGQYAQERLMGKVYLGFTFVAISLSMIGLFTFAMYETRRRRKEIGIRKVHGADIPGLLYDIGSDFFIIVLRAVLLALPLSWYLTHHWLEGYAFRIAIGPWPFVSAVLIAMVLAFLAVGWQTLGIVRSDPVHALREDG